MREDTQRFYEDRLGMDRYCYTFERTFETSRAGSGDVRVEWGVGR